MTEHRNNRPLVADKRVLQDVTHDIEPPTKRHKTNNYNTLIVYRNKLSFDFFDNSIDNATFESMYTTLISIPLNRYYGIDILNDLIKLIAVYSTTLIQWKWDYDCMHVFGENYDYHTHTFSRNKQTLECNVKSKRIAGNGKSLFVQPCNCCFQCNIEMKPNSGIYTIKLKIDKIKNSSTYMNMVGITSGMSDRNKMHYWDTTPSHIGWCAYDSNNIGINIHGLTCESTANVQENSIFYKKPNRCIYQSRNDNYKNRLPTIDNDDVLILIYDSNKNELNFTKENDEKLDAFISNLPADTIFYWMVGHNSDTMSITIQNDT